MKLIKLLTPSGRVERVSTTAAGFAVMYDKIARYPAAQKQLSASFECLKQGVASLEALEKITPPGRINDVLSKIFGEIART